MNGIISFCGIDIRKVGDVLCCCSFVSKDKPYTPEIKISSIQDVYFKTFNSNRTDDKPYIAIRALKDCGRGSAYYHFYIPTYIGVGESECEDFVKGIKKMIGMEVKDQEDVV